MAVRRRDNVPANRIKVRIRNLIKMAVFVYEMAADLLDLPPGNIMMVAAHKGDLRAAQAVGFKTGFVPRPLEHGPGGEVDTTPESDFDINAEDFLDLARQLGT